MPKLVQAEFRSKQGASIPNSPAMVAASAGVRESGAEPPAITRPMAPGSIPARAMAIRAARAPVRAFP